MEFVYAYLHTMSQNGDKKQFMNEKNRPNTPTQANSWTNASNGWGNKSNSIL